MGKNSILSSGQSAGHLVSRNVVIGSHRTSIRLEPDMWHALEEITVREGQTIHELATMIDHMRGGAGSLTSAIRVFIMSYFRQAATEHGHIDAGHGSEIRHITRGVA